MTHPDDPHPPENDAFASRIRDTRCRNAYAVETLAELAGVPPSVVVALEEGKAISDTAAVDRVLDVLGMRRRSPKWR